MKNLFLLLTFSLLLTGSYATTAYSQVVPPDKGVYQPRDQAPYWGQDPPRQDDHFWRRRIQYTIELDEKINYPMKEVESMIYDYTLGPFPNKRGLINTLFESFQKGEIRAFDKDTLWKEMTYQEFVRILKDKAEIADDTPAPGPADEPTDDGIDFEDDFDTGFDDDVFGDDLFPEEDLGGGGEGGEGGADVLPTGGGVGGGTTLTLQDIVRDYLSTKLYVLEERIFDKNKSSMFYHTQYIQLFYVDETAPAKEEAIVSFIYDDALMEVLNLTQWKNRWNDAEYRSMKEIIDLRLHNHYFIDVSGTPMLSLMEAQDRSHMQIEFEHNLWEF